MTGSLLLAGLLLAQSHAGAVATTTPDASAGNPAIIANAPASHRSGWLTTSGPNPQGQYMVWINVADLDATTEAGKRAMASRVQRASAMLCDMSAEGPRVAGFYDRETRECWSQTESQASNQIARAEREGRPVATLGFAASPRR